MCGGCRVGGGGGDYEDLLGYGMHIHVLNIVLPYPGYPVEDFFFSRVRRDGSRLTHLNLMDEGTTGDAARNCRIIKSLVWLVASDSTYRLKVMASIVKEIS